MQRRRQHAVPQRQHHLDHSGHPRRRLGVTDVRLHRPQPRRAVFRPVLAVGGQQRLRLDRVAEHRPAAVCLNRVDLIRADPGAGQRGPDHPLLGGAVRRGQPVGRPVLVHRAAGYHRQHLVPVAPRVGQPLHHQHPGPLGHAHAVGRGRERLAPPVLGQAELTAEPERSRGGDHGHAGGQRQRALPRPQRLAGQVERDQRGRTGRVHRHRRSLKPEGVGHPTRDHAAQVARRQMSLGGGGVRQQDRVVPLRPRADEHPGRRGPQRSRDDARPLQRLPADLEQQSLLRVHRQRLAGADPEESRVELGRVGYESAFVPGPPGPSPGPPAGRKSRLCLRRSAPIAPLGSGSRRETGSSSLRSRQVRGRLPPVSAGACESLAGRPRLSSSSRRACPGCPSTAPNRPRAPDHDEASP